MDRLLVTNWVALKLKELRVKARNKTDTLWKLWDRLLLRNSKLYILDGQLTPKMPLRTILIKEAYEQLLLGHPGYAKLYHLIQSCYY
jgi:hypothetical protein